MPEQNQPDGDLAAMRRLASEMLKRRMLRSRYFDRLSFSEQRWDMMLMLFGEAHHTCSVDEASRALSMSPATTLALARILAGQDLAKMSDSDGGWNEIPISLTAEALAKLNAYFRELLDKQLVV